MTKEPLAIFMSWWVKKKEGLRYCKKYFMLQQLLFGNNSADQITCSLFSDHYRLKSKLGKFAVDITNTFKFVNLRWMLTHWGRDKIAAIAQMTFSHAFSWMKMYELRLKFHWNLFPRVQLTILQHWFRQWLGAVQATNHYLKQWWSIHRHIYVSLGLNELTTNCNIVHIFQAIAC